MLERWEQVWDADDEIHVSDLGRIRRGSKEPTHGSRRKDGYCVVSYRSAGRMATQYVHRVVLEAFYGLCPKGMESRHLNGDNSDNRLVNLEWATHRANIGDKRSHGTLSRAGLNDRTVAQIIESRRAGATLKSLAEKYGVSTATIGLISQGKRWQHVWKAVNAA